MPRASKRFLDKSVWDQIHKTLTKVISSYNQAEMEKFLTEFLTKEEKIMLAKRLTLYVMLLAGYSDIEIKEVLKISFETIRSARRSLEAKSKRFREDLVSLADKPKKSGETNRLIKMLDLALSAKSDIKSRAKLTSGDY